MLVNWQRGFTRVSRALGAAHGRGVRGTRLTSSIRRNAQPTTSTYFSTDSTTHDAALLGGGSGSDGGDGGAPPAAPPAQRDKRDGTNFVFLGTAAGSPSVFRNGTSHIFRWHGFVFLIDCAEATMHQNMKLREHTASTPEAILITHLHSDHVMGLTTFILHGLIALNARSKDKFETERPTLSIYGPPGIYNLLCATISLTHSALSCNVSVYEYEMDNPPTTRRSVWARTQALATPSAQFAHPRITRIPVQEASKGVWELPSVQTRHNHDTRTLSIRAVATRHTVPSVSYVFEESTLQGTIDAKKTTALGLPPGREYRMLKQGKDVELPDGRIVRAADVVTPPIRGRKIVVAADTCDASALEPHAQDCDLLIHEATLAGGERAQARARGHATGGMAGQLAKAVNAKRLALTHFGGKTNMGIPRQEVEFDWNSAEIVPRVEPSLRQTRREALEAFGKNAVTCAHDLLVIPIPIGGFSEPQDYVSKYRSRPGDVESDANATNGGGAGRGGMAKRSPRRSSSGSSRGRGAAPGKFRRENSGSSNGYGGDGEYGAARDGGGERPRFRR